MIINNTKDNIINKAEKYQTSNCILSNVGTHISNNCNYRIILELGLLIFQDKWLRKDHNQNINLGKK